MSNSAPPATASPAARAQAEAPFDPAAGQAPAPTVPGSLTDHTIALPWVTGPNSETNQNWFIRGTDLGIMWNSGYVDPVTQKPIIFTLFGDTYSEPNFGGDWRYNVLLRSWDTDLSDGLQFNDAVISPGGVYSDNVWWRPTSSLLRAGATEIIRTPPNGYLGLFGSTHTIIPTSAIAVDNGDGTFTQYATVMSVRTWNNPGSWTTNWSAIAVSQDGGLTWAVDESTVRSSGWLRASKSFAPGNERFQQNALVMSSDPDDPYVYVYGTPSGRQGSAYVARVEKGKITDLGSYEYFAGNNADGTGRWVTGNPAAATAILGPDKPTFLTRVINFIDSITFGCFSKIFGGIISGGMPTGGNISEMSVQYNEYLGKYVVTYTDAGNNVVMRVSDTPQGTWSEPTRLITNNPLSTNTGMYGPMIHPMSGTDYFNGVDDDGNVIDNSQYLYYNVSFWGPYNVRLMRTDLAPVMSV